MSDAEPTKAPCKQVPGNTWYEFTAHGHKLGASLPTNRRKPTLDVTSVGDQWTLTIVDEKGEPLNALAVTKPSKRAR